MYDKNRHVAQIHKHQFYFVEKHHWKKKSGHLLTGFENEKKI